MVVGGEDTTEQQYAHCVLEMSIAYDNLRTAKASAELKEIELEEMAENLRKKGWLMGRKWIRREKLNIQIKTVELEQLNRARLGAMREFECLYNLWQSFPVKYTREQLNEAQPEYWKRRITRQANQEVMAYGRVGAGNLEALRQIGLGAVPQLDVVREVERRYLKEGGMARILIAVPTVEKAVNGLPCLDGVIIPSMCEAKVFNVWGRTTAEAYNEAAMQAVKDNADYMLTIEDDVFPPSDAIVKLLDLAKANPDHAIGAWYPKREHPRQGVHIVLKGENRDFLEDDFSTRYTPLLWDVRSIRRKCLSKYLNRGFRLQLIYLKIVSSHNLQEIMDTSYS
jgi:hypothetical protein